MRAMVSATVPFALLLSVLLACAPGGSALQETSDSDFRPGQVWKYRTRAGEEGSRFVVCKVEVDPRLGTIVHVALEGVKINSPTSPDGIVRAVGHMPFAEEALRKSVVEVEQDLAELPDYEDGYTTWKEAFDSGNAGIFTISVSEGVAFMEEAVSR